MKRWIQIAEADEHPNGPLTRAMLEQMVRSFDERKADLALTEGFMLSRCIGWLTALQVVTSPNGRAQLLAYVDSAVLRQDFSIAYSVEGELILLDHASMIAPRG